MTGRPWDGSDTIFPCVLSSPLLCTWSPRQNPAAWAQAWRGVGRRGSGAASGGVSHSSRTPNSNQTQTNLNQPLNMSSFINQAYARQTTHTWRARTPGIRLRAGRWILVPVEASGDWVTQGAICCAGSVVRRI